VHSNTTVTLSSEVKQAVDELSRSDGISPDEVVDRAVRQHVFLRKFHSLRERMAEKAKSQGIVTDQDVFDRIS
jgi:predicted transcriptional regulator